MDQPTRARSTQTPHTLDLIIANEECINDIEYLSPIGKSDYNVLAFTFRWKHDNCITTENKLNYGKGNYDQLRDNLRKDWDYEFSSCNEDVEACWTKFKEILEDGTKQFIPIVRNASWKRKQHWNKIPKGLVELVH